MSCHTIFLRNVHIWLQRSIFCCFCMECMFMSTISIWSKVWFKPNISCWSSVWIIYSLLKVGYWRPQLLMYFCLAHFISISICLLYLGAPSLSVYILQLLTPHDEMTHFHYIMTFLSFYHFWLKVYFSDISVAIPVLFWFLFRWNIFFIPSLLVYVYH